MNCTICRKPVVLNPTAAERAKKYGDQPASYYTALFTEHAACTLRKRSEDTQALMRRSKRALT